MSILGTRVIRTEDPRLLTAGGVYVDDLRTPELDGAAHVTFVRSPVAHARITGVDAKEASQEPGVIAVLTVRDMDDLAPPDSGEAGSGEGPMPLGGPWSEPLLAVDTVRFVGEPVAAVITDGRYQGEDAADLVSVDYEPLPAVVGPAAAITDASLLFPVAGTNVALTKPVSTDDAPFDACDMVVEQDIVNQRVACLPMEGRATAASYRDGKLTVWHSSQNAQLCRMILCGALGMAPDQIRVVVPDVGGGFGAKVGIDRDALIVAWAARKLGRALRWTETRSENLVGMTQGRAQLQHVKIGGNRDGRILAYRQPSVVEAVQVLPVKRGHADAELRMAQFGVAQYGADPRGQRARARRGTGLCPCCARAAVPCLCACTHAIKRQRGQRNVSPHCSHARSVAAAMLKPALPSIAVALVRQPAAQWRLRSRTLELGVRTLVMGVVNITPDSFSDGGNFLDPQAAIARGLEMLEEGADFLDLGAESTRPGSRAGHANAVVSADEEQVRLLPVLEGILRARPGSIVSVDTYKAPTARAALRAGAEIINDVSGFSWDASMALVCSEARAGLVVMHTRGRPEEWRSQDRLDAEAVLDSVRSGLRESLQTARAAGVAPEAIVLDPGYGFGKRLDENYALLSRQAQLLSLGRPLLAGLSRKSFLGQTLAPLHGGEPAPAAQREAASIAALTAAILNGASIVRVHNVRPAVETARIADAILAAS